MPIYAGLDVGTTAAKAVLVDGEGRELATSITAMPPLETTESAVWQDLDATLRSVDTVVSKLLAAGPRPDWIALTTQRDTVVLLDPDGVPATPMISWRDRRESAAGTLWDALMAEGVDLTCSSGVYSLASTLARHWGAGPTEARGTVSRHVTGRRGARLDALAAHPVPRATVVVEGAEVARLEGVPVRVAGGDKNCEHLAMGVSRAGAAGLSLGTAISLGMIARDRPDPPSGVVVTPAPLAGYWNVETGLLGGLDGQQFLDALQPPVPPASPEFADAPWMLPYFAGALDAPRATVEIVGVDGSTGRPRLRQAWVQGVLGELRRLRPRLEEAAAAPMHSLTVGGGGSADPAWGQLAADALGVPVRQVDDPWLGARGAVAAVLFAEQGAQGEAFLRRGLADAATHDPAPERAAVVAAYYDTWDALSRAARAKDPTSA